MVNFCQKKTTAKTIFFIVFAVVFLFSLKVQAVGPAISDFNQNINVTSQKGFLVIAESMTIDFGNTPTNNFNWVLPPSSKNLFANEKKDEEKIAVLIDQKNISSFGLSYHSDVLSPVRLEIPTPNLIGKHKLEIKYVFLPTYTISNGVARFKFQAIRAINSSIPKANISFSFEDKSFFERDNAFWVDCYIGEKKTDQCYKGQYQNVEVNNPQLNSKNDFILDIDISDFTVSPLSTVGYNLNKEIKTKATSDRSYSYPSIDFNFNVNKDSTVDVTEKEAFDFIGEYHLGWRTLKLDKIDKISDIEVIDEETNLPLKYVSSRLDKTDPNSWGLYTVFTENNAQNIEWYYNQKDSTHSWILKYKLHGAIGFYKDHDELYWNLLTDFTVPIDKITATVKLPKETSMTGPFSAYRSNPKSTIEKEQLDGSTFFFQALNVTPGEDVTIAPGWMKEIVSHNAYWLDFFFSYWGALTIFILLIITLIGSYLYWYVMEKRPMNKMTIVAEYEPPENLPPAMAEIIVKESISSKAWPATIIDLACRGYLTITEDNTSRWQRFTQGKKVSPLIVILVLIALFILIILSPKNLISVYISTIIPLAIFLGLWILVKIMFLPVSEFVLTKTGEGKEELNGFEKLYYQMLFKSKDTFSTKEEKENKSTTHAKKMYEELNNIKKELYNQMQVKTKAYAIAPKAIGGASLIGVLILFRFAALMFRDFGSVFSGPHSQIYIFSVGAIIIAVIIYLTLRNPRLNQEGRALKAEWLGFKLYLGTAEKYRMQNLTPEMFEKYLPYAMIFGIEKKWAKAFSSMNVPQPTWYQGNTYIGTSAMGNSGLASGFSATAFSSSFSSSLASSFSGSASGGGAGGGGGGGGGGAS